jgi:hypothetical protein
LRDGKVYAFDMELGDNLGKVMWEYGGNVDWTDDKEIIEEFKLANIKATAEEERDRICEKLMVKVGTIWEHYPKPPNEFKLFLEKLPYHIQRKIVPYDSNKGLQKAGNDIIYLQKEKELWEIEYSRSSTLTVDETTISVSRNDVYREMAQYCGETLSDYGYEDIETNDDFSNLIKAHIKPKKEHLMWEVYSKTKQYPKRPLSELTSKDTLKSLQLEMCCEEDEIGILPLQLPGFITSGKELSF